MKKISLIPLLFCLGLQALAGMKLCFHINGQLHCIDIPVEVNREWPWDVRTFDPSIAPEIQRDLAILHLMDHLAGQMTPDVGRLVQGEVQTLAAMFEIRSGAQLVFQKRRADGSHQWELWFEEQGIKVEVPKAFHFDKTIFSDAVLGPDPTPWMVLEALERETLQNLRILATLSEMTQDLSSDVAQKIESTIASALDQLQLPKDVQIRM